MKFSFLAPLFLLFLLFCLPLGLFAQQDHYAGMDVCRSCHRPVYEDFLKSVHGKREIPGSPLNLNGCELCHGPGLAHVAKGGGRGKEIFNFRGEESGRKSLKCLQCHEQSRNVAFWDLSSHKAARISCDKCHSMHYGKKKYLTEAEPYLCFNCHPRIRAQVNKQSRHPIEETIVRCSGCHNSMGSFGPKMLKADSVNELCYECHSEKRGPYFWEHPPVAEKCLNCHVPHGSNHGRLLARKRPLLCQSCHDAAGHPGTPYTKFDSFKGPNPRNFFVGRSCLNCHTNIHGSNGPSERGSHFLR